MRITIGLLATLLLMLSTACGNDDADNGGPVTIRFSWWGNDDRAKITNQAVDAFEKANPNITVKTESIDFNSYFDRLATSVAAGDEPDVITMGGAYPREYADRGVLLDMTAVAGDLDLSKLDEPALSNGNFGGKQYGVPTGVNTYGVIVNPAIFKAAGVKVPDDDKWSWNDYVRIATDISAKSPKGTYGSDDPTAPETLDLYANQRTGEGLYSKKGGIAIDKKTVRDWFTMTSGLMKRGATPPADVSAEQDAQSAPEQTLLAQGKAAMMFGWSNLLTAYEQAAGTRLVMLRAPGETTEKKGTGMWLQASQLYTISKHSKHPEAAAKLIDFLVSDERAADLIKADRGIPANEEIRTHLEENLDPSTKAEYDFVDRMSKLVDGEFVIGPTGSTESPDILTRANQSVLFGQSTPDQGADRFVTELTNAVS
jgi:pectin-derived oligosaccharide transport system substrate-binding protein